MSQWADRRVGGLIGVQYNLQPPPLLPPLPRHAGPHVIYVFLSRSETRLHCSMHVITSASDCRLPLLLRLLLPPQTMMHL